MKILKTFLLFMGSLIITGTSRAQPINWKNLQKDNKQLATITAGLDYGLVFGAGYSYQLTTGRPILLHAEISVPSGENIFDDFKTKTGGRINLYQQNHFYASASLHGIYRRSQNAFVRLQNFGAELSGDIGYYKPRWFAAIAVGFDKAILTQLKHSAVYKQNYPAVKDGWYGTSTGGNFNFGLQTGYSLKHSDITLQIGKLVSQDFSTKPLLPFYFQLGYTFKIGKAGRQ